MPDNLPPSTAAARAICDRVDSAALQQLTLLESTMHALRPRLNDEDLETDDMLELVTYLESLSLLMLQWTAVLVGTPANAHETAGDEDEEGEE